MLFETEKAAEAGLNLGGQASPFGQQRLDRIAAAWPPNAESVPCATFKMRISAPRLGEKQTQASPLICLAHRYLA
jgi:hypothetical protein